MNTYYVTEDIDLIAMRGHGGGAYCVRVYDENCKAVKIIDIPAGNRAAVVRWCVENKMVNVHYNWG